MLTDSRYAIARETHRKLIQRVSDSQDGNPIAKFFDENNDVREEMLFAIENDSDPSAGDLLNYLLVRLLASHSAEGLASHLRYLRQQMAAASEAIPE